MPSFKGRDESSEVRGVAVFVTHHLRFGFGKVVIRRKSPWICKLIALPPESRFGPSRRFIDPVLCRKPIVHIGPKNSKAPTLRTTQCTTTAKRFLKSACGNGIMMSANGAIKTFPIAWNQGHTAVRASDPLLHWMTRWSN